METFSAIWGLVVLVFNFLTSSTIANLASLIGLAISIVVLLNVRNIREDFIAAVRTPQLAEELIECASKLSKLIAEYSTCKDQIEDEIAICLAKVKSIKHKLRGANNKSCTNTVDELITMLSTYINVSDGRNKESARKIYTKLITLNEEVKNFIEDQKWRTRDAG